jgi:hypothetical protein
MAGLACLPLFGALFADQKVASWLGSAVILLLPLLSLGLLWRTQIQSNYELRRLSFLLWGTLIILIGVTNFMLIQEHSNSHSTIIMLGLVCIAISFHARYKASKQKATMTT